MTKRLELTCDTSRETWRCRAPNRQSMGSTADRRRSRKWSSPGPARGDTLNWRCWRGSFSSPDRLELTKRGRSLPSLASNITHAVTHSAVLTVLRSYDVAVTVILIHMHRLKKAQNVQKMQMVEHGARLEILKKGKCEAERMSWLIGLTLLVGN